MPRGGPGPGEAVLKTQQVQFQGSPSDRLISGWLTVNVRNKETTDANLAYFRGWSKNPNSIPENETTPGNPPEGTYPYYSDPEWDNVDEGDSFRPGYPTDEIFEHGEGGEVGPSESRAYGRGSTGRTFESVDPATMKAQVTRIIIGCSGADIVDKSYFIIPTRNAYHSESDDENFMGNGKCGIWFHDTDTGHTGEPALTSNGGINHWIRVDYSSVSNTSIAAIRTTMINAMDNALTYGDFGTGANPLAIFGASSTFSSDGIDVPDKEVMRRSDAYTDIHIMNDAGTNHEGSVSPTGWGIKTLTKGSKVGFNKMESHLTTNEGDMGSLGPDERYVASKIAKEDKELGIGDYDTFIFFVTQAAHISPYDYAKNGTHGDYFSWATVNGVSPDSGAVPFTEGGNVLYWHHHSCQSFIKSTLIARHNNCSNGDAYRTNSQFNVEDEDTSFWTVGSEVTKYTFGRNYPTGGRRAEDGTTLLTRTTEHLQNNGIYRHGKWIDGVYQDESSVLGDRRFGIDLGYEHTDEANAYPEGDLDDCNGTNNFFSPVHSIDIGISHMLHPNTGHGNTSGTSHPIDYGLGVRIHLYSVNPHEGGGGSPHEFFNSQCNVFWQPFGETGEFKLSSSV